MEMAQKDRLDTSSLAPPPGTPAAPALAGSQPFKQKRQKKQHQAHQQHVSSIIEGAWRGVAWRFLPFFLLSHTGC
jgi:hypothetical protein